MRAISIASKIFCPAPDLDRRIRVRTRCAKVDKIKILPIASTLLWFFLPLGSSSGQTAGLPATGDFMNVLALCGAGSGIKIEGNLKGSISSIYEKERTEGKAIQDIITKTIELMPSDQRLAAYNAYLGCVERRLTQNSTPAPPRKEGEIQKSQLTKLLPSAKPATGRWDISVNCSQGGKFQTYNAAFRGGRYADGSSKETSSGQPFLMDISLGFEEKDSIRMTGFAGSNPVFFEFAGAKQADTATYAGGGTWGSGNCGFSARYIGPELPPDESQKILVKTLQAPASPVSGAWNISVSCPDGAKFWSNGIALKGGRYASGTGKDSKDGRPFVVDIALGFASDNSLRMTGLAGSDPRFVDFTAGKTGNEAYTGSGVWGTSKNCGFNAQHVGSESPDPLVVTTSSNYRGTWDLEVRCPDEKAFFHFPKVVFINGRAAAGLAGKHAIYEWSLFSEGAGVRLGGYGIFGKDSAKIDIFATPSTTDETGTQYVGKGSLGTNSNCNFKGFKYARSL